MGSVTRAWVMDREFMGDSGGEDIERDLNAATLASMDDPKKIRALLDEIIYRNTAAMRELIEEA